MTAGMLATTVQNKPTVIQPQQQKMETPTD